MYNNGTAGPIIGLLFHKLIWLLLSGFPNRLSSWGGN